MNQTTPTQDYFQYKAHPHQFYKFITKQQSENTNPLYSQQSLKKYFRKKSHETYKHPAYEFYTSRRKIECNANVKEKLQKFDQLQALIRKSKLAFNSNKFIHKIDMVEQYADKSEDHFKSLNFQDGICPLDSFSRANFSVKRYITELITPQKTKRVTVKQKRRELRKRTHAEHIVDYLRQQQIQSRYRVQPKSASKVDHSILDQAWEVDNRKIRSKTEYCRKKYHPPTLQEEKINEEIMQESRAYMKKGMGKTYR